MINVWVVESLEHVFGKLAQLVFRQVEGAHQFVHLHTTYERTHHFVVQCIAHDVDAAEVCHRAQHGVRPVEQCHLAFVVWFFRIDYQYVESCFRSRELCFHLVDSHVVGAFDDPQVECLALHHEVVFVAYALPYIGNFLAWESGNDAVNQRCTYVAVGLKPAAESFVVGS